ncbi:S-layer homology domain-containing protein [Metallumcola ferriviriculae]|uniref:S-layer homology domain-containing protein n=1 Tax=Metallumcola ferriviriculae TaxID=3039180 RepID=A0AAU0UME0_9FIRM|nr:S-layer homology domain-containing protein [Desulfitibacteraceae bacterium MK1]
MGIKKKLLGLAVIIILSIWTSVGVEAADGLLPVEHRSIYAGSAVSYYITAGGKLYGAGRNTQNQLGNGTKIDSATPILILEDAVFVEGGLKNYAITSNGDLYTWGVDRDGPLEPAIKPHKILSNVSSVSECGGRAVAVSRKGELYEIDYYDNTRKLMDNVKSASVGYSFTVVVKRDGTVLFWEGSLEKGTAQPKEVLDNVVHVVSGSGHTLALKNDGTLWAWGNNYDGQVGVDSRYARNGKTPTKIMENVRYIDAVNGPSDSEKNGESSLAIKNDGSLWIWGKRAGGGPFGDDMRMDVPYKVMDGVLTASIGSHLLAVKIDGSLWAMGYNNTGQFGNGQTYWVDQPVKIMSDVKDIAASETYGMAIKNDGTVWAWGKIKNASDGDRWRVYRGWDDIQNEKDLISNTPVRVFDFDNAIEIAAAPEHRLVLLEDGSLWAWGDNYASKLGDNTTKDSANPIKVMDEVKSIEVNRNNSLALKYDGTLYSWGEIETLSEYASKPPQKKADNVVAFDSMWDGIIYVSEDGEIYSSVHAGEANPKVEKDLYNGDNIWVVPTNNTGQPYVLPTNVTKLLGNRLTGLHYTYALTSDGTFYGANAVSDKFDSEQQPIKIMDDVKDISGMNPYIVKSDGTLFRYEYGDPNKPILSNIHKIDTAWESGLKLALDNDGNVYAWGGNTYGQVGNGTQSFYAEPVQLRNGIMVPKDEYSPSPWAVGEIEKGKQYNLVTEKVLSSYQRDITREEFCEIVVKLYEALAGKTVAESLDSNFSDTNNQEILKANSLGIVKGISETEFAPYAIITREQIAVMFYRTLIALDPSLAKEKWEVNFADKSEISSWALDAIGFMNANGILGGMGNNKVIPKGNATREQAIALIVRIFEKFN